MAIDVKIKKMAKAVVNISKGKAKKKPKPYSPLAVVRRIEGNTAYVHIMSEGSDREAVFDETPVEYNIGAKVGDVVRLRIEGKKAWIVGNTTSPPTDDTGVRKLSKVVYNMEGRMDSGEFKGEQGEPGKDGTDGRPGASPIKIVIEHCLASVRSIPSGHNFDEYRETAWTETLPDYPSTGTHYYWKRTVSYLEDETVLTGDPEFDLEAQVSYESTKSAADSASSAQDAQTAAETAANEAEAAKDAAQDIDDNVKKHFWFDSSTGLHVSETENSYTTGTSANIKNNNFSLTKNGNAMMIIGQNSVNFYDGDGSVPTSNDLLAAYSKSGITFYSNKKRSTSITNSATTFWDPSDTTTGTNQRKLALYSKDGVNLYAYTTSGSTTTGGIVANLGKNALNFYDGTAVTPSTDNLLASYTRSGTDLYTQGTSSKNSRAASFTPSGLTFWDPSDTTNSGTASQRKEATFGTGGAHFYGNDNGTNVECANFTPTGASIGRTDGAHINIDSSEVKFYKNANNLLNVGLETDTSKTTAFIKRNIPGVANTEIDFVTSSLNQPEMLLSSKYLYETTSGRESSIDITPSYLTLTGDKYTSIQLSDAGIYIQASSIHSTLETVSLTSSDFATDSTSKSTFVSAYMRRFAQTVQLALTVKVKSTAVAASADVYNGTLAGNMLSYYLPDLTSYGCGYYGGSSLIGLINHNGNVIIRNTAASLAANSQVTVSFTYLINS